MRILPRPIRDVMRWLWGSPEINGALADNDTIPVKDASDGAVKTTLLSRLVTYILAAIPIAYGTWAPTVTGVTNIASVTSPGTGFYIRVGSIVAWWVTVTFQTTAGGGTFSVIRLTPPVSTNFGVISDAAGFMTVGDTGSQISARVIANVANDLLDVFFGSNSNSSNTSQIFGGYKVI